MKPQTPTEQRHASTKIVLSRARTSLAQLLMTEEQKKATRKRYMQVYRQANLDKWKRTPEQQKKINARKKERYAMPENEQMRIEARAKVRAWQLANPDMRKSQRIKHYGLSLEAFRAILAGQDGKCAICGYSDLSMPKLFPLIDHCHETNAIRGILCTNCNMGLGLFKSSSLLLSSAIGYLTKNNG